MAHWIGSEFDDEFLPTGEVIRRLRREFKYVKSSQVEGKWAIIRQIMAALMCDDGRYEPATLQKIDRFADVYFDAFHVTIADRKPIRDSVPRLAFTLNGEARIFLSYENGLHEEATAGLRERLAAVLGYEIELI